MGLCEYAFYKDEEKFYPRLYCKVDNKWCHYVKRCEKVEKFIPIKDNVWEECGKYIMEKRKDIPAGSYFVQATRPSKQGNLFLYVLINDDKIERISSKLTELKQNYIYLRKNNNVYEVSLEPFKEEKKENIIIHVNEELVTEKKRGRKKKTDNKVKEDE
jgi:hypothetical protein